MGMIKAEDIKGALETISELIEKNRAYLIELDQQNGDGDLGISMDEGFKAVVRYLQEAQEDDLGRLFLNVSKVFNEAAPSSLGTILSIGIMGIAKALKGEVETDLPGLTGALEAGVGAIMEKAKSKQGEKTILDSLIPGIETLKEYSDSSEEAYREAFLSAGRGSEKTREMKPVHGRAAYYGEKSIGMLDGGSVVGRIIFEGVFSYYRKAEMEFEGKNM